MSRYPGWIARWHRRPAGARTGHPLGLRPRQGTLSEPWPARRPASSAPGTACRSAWKRGTRPARTSSQSGGNRPPSIRYCANVRRPGRDGVPKGWARWRL